jgi:hypothetical protein
MRSLLLVFLTFAFLMFAGMVQTAFADCSSEDRIELAEEGYSETQINQQCSSGQNAFAPPPGYGAAMTCVTQWGSCALSQPSQPGFRCACITPYGNEIAGVAQ